MDSIPFFLRRPLERDSLKQRIEFKPRAQAPAQTPRPQDIIHGGAPPLQPDFLTATTSRAVPPLAVASVDSAGVVDLTAHRGAARVSPALRKMSQALHAVFEAEAGVEGEDDDAAFQVTLPRSVIRQIRLCAAEQGTTHRAVVLRALRGAGLNIPEGADVDRRVQAAKRRYQA